MTLPQDNLPVVLGEVLVDVALDEGGLPGAKLADDQHLDITLTISDQCLKISHQLVGLFSDLCDLLKLRIHLE